MKIQAISKSAEYQNFKKEKMNIEFKRREGILKMRKCLFEMLNTDPILEYEKYQKLIKQYHEFSDIHDTAVLSVWS